MQILDNAMIGNHASLTAILPVLVLVIIRFRIKAAFSSLILS
jgi:hypothetical protein